MLSAAVETSYSLEYFESSSEFTSLILPAPMPPTRITVGLAGSGLSATAVRLAEARSFLMLATVSSVSAFTASTTTTCKMR